MNMQKSLNPHAGILDRLFHDVTDCAAKANMEVWAECGTLLGIVRHRDYIPWETDLDFGARADDIKPGQADRFQNLMELRKYCVTLFPSHWHVAVPGSECHADIALYSVTDKAVAIVPVRGPGDRTLAKIVHSALCIVDQRSLGVRPNSRRMRDTWKIRIQRMCSVLPGFVRRATASLLEKILVLTSVDVSWRVPAELIAESQPHQFRNITIRVPVKAECLLAFRYGDDWRTPNPDWNMWNQDRAIVAQDRLP